METNWWRNRIVYQVLLPSFFDSNRDGTGDIQGIIDKLEYLDYLGVDAIWLSPVFSSPMHDLGYDVSDYRSVNPVFGSMADLKCLISESHRWGIRIILDMVINHTSISHPWFVESRSSLTNHKRDWYIWKDGRGKQPPNNWKSVYTGSAWEFDQHSGQYYYHTFFRQQPDLNWRNPDVQAEFMDILRFWLDAGIDGFRLDAINMIIKAGNIDESRSLPAQLLNRENFVTRNQPESIDIVAKIRALVDGYGDRLIVGEIYTLPPGHPATVARYLSGQKEMLHMAFDFSMIFRRWAALPVSRAVEKWMLHIPPGSWPCHVLSNHDLHRSLHSGWWRKRTNEKAKIQAMLLLTLKGTPFLYYGEEIGMRNTRIPRSSIRDPLGKKFWPLYSGRDKSRTPMQWTNGKYAGFSEVTPWLPVNKDFIFRNVESSLEDGESVLQFYRRLIRFRRSSNALLSGQWNPLIPSGRNVMAYLRVSEEEILLILLNFSGRVARPGFLISGTLQVLLSTHRDASNKIGLSQLKLFPYEATIFKISSE
jgi:alpha-glucosidase